MNGEPQAAAWLKDALAATTSSPMEHVHGFHPYPARMHPGIARAVLSSLEERGALLDPFCGSGTCLVEARLQGRSAIGVDLNPLAVRLARLKACPPDEGAAAALLDAANAVVEASCERVKAKSKVRAPLKKRDLELYPPHVLLELAGLLVEVRRVGDPFVRGALELVFSSLVTKFSKLEGETGGNTTEKRIGRFVPSRFFGKKAADLVERWGQYRALLQESGPSGDAGAVTPWESTRAVSIEGDARELRAVLTGAQGGVTGPPAVVVTSPPYGGTYDYRSHHRIRAAWLGLDDQRFDSKEMGARRRLSQGEPGPARWDKELGGALRSLADVLTEGAPAVLLLGDGEVAGERIAADEQLRRIAPGRGFVVVASASETRPDWRRGPDREEHLVLLRRAPPT